MSPATMEDRLAEAAQSQPVHARQILSRLIVGRLIFNPRNSDIGAHYEFTGLAIYGRLLKLPLSNGA